MRFVWAVVAFFFAAVLIGGGIAQRTIFVGPDSDQAQIEVTADLPYRVIDGSVFGSLPGTQTLAVRGDDGVFVAYGRTADMNAWLADTAYDQVALDANGEITTTEVAAVVDPVEDADPHDPTTSDLWLEQFQEDGAVVEPMKLPADMSVLIASDGVEPAPADISVSWSLDNSTPWAGPLIVAGAVLFAVGLLLYILGIHHVRKSRGPRRKGPPPLPKTEPIEITEAGKGEIDGGTATSRRAVSDGRKALLAVPVLGLAAVMFTGCTAQSWPQFGADATATPSPTSTVIVPEDQQAPAVTEAQAARIVAEISKTVAAADEEMDADLAATRLTGMALAERKTNYALRASVADHPALGAIPERPIEILLPQAMDGWPRTVLSIVRDRSDSTVAPTMMMLEQQDPWAPYKVSYIADMEAATELPPLAPAWLGAPAVPPDSRFLTLAPGELAAAYADVLDEGEDSAYWDLFDTESDQFREGVIKNREDLLAQFNETGAETGTLTFDAVAGKSAPVSLATLESGAIVAVDLREVDLVKPTNEDAVIKLDGNPTVQALAGTDQSATGFATTYVDQIFFYVPVQGSEEKIRLLGYGSNILNAKVIE